MLPLRDIDRLFGRFFLELINPKGKCYKNKKKMLKKVISYRHGTQSHLQEIRPDIEIIHGSEFRGSCKIFK